MNQLYFPTASPFCQVLFLPALISCFLFYSHLPLFYFHVCSWVYLPFSLSSLSLTCPFLLCPIKFIWSLLHASLFASLPLNVFTFYSFLFIKQCLLPSSSSSSLCPGVGVTFFSFFLPCFYPLTPTQTRKSSREVRTRGILLLLPNRETHTGCVLWNLNTA